MSRESSSTTRAVATVLEDMTFVPTPNMMKVKAKFYTNWHGMKMPTQADVMQITGVSTVKNWWTHPGFKDWFFNRDSVYTQLTYLKDLALKTAEDLLRDPDANSSAKVNMVKTILAYHEAVESKRLEASSVDISQLSTEELETRLKRVVGDGEKE